MKRNRKGALLLAAAIAITAGNASGLQKNAGTNAAEFLKIGAGARALGMGEAFGPVAEGPEAIYWNPAGLAQIRRPEFSYTRSEFLRFFHHDFAAYAHPVGFLKGTLAASYSRLSQDSLPVVTNANVSLGRFSPESHAVALGYAHAFDLNADGRDRDYFREAWTLPGTMRPLRDEHEPWTGTLMLGLSAKVLYETLYDRSAQALAFDGGAIFRPVDLQQLSLSFAFRNAGGRERFIRESQSLPAEVDLGLAYDHRAWQSRLLPAFELALPYYGNPYAKLGVEYLKEMGGAASVAFRAGYKTLAATDLSPLSGLTAGVGVKYRRLSVDFGFQPVAELGQVYRVGIGLQW